MAKKKRKLTIVDQLRAAIAAEESLYRAAKKSGVPLPTITRFMNNRRDMRMETAARVCTALGLELQRVEK